MRVQHRHIIYIQGYDPRGLAQYYRMFRTELRKFGQLYQLATTISRPKVAAEGEIASWTIETRDNDWQTRTHYDFLRWEDLIKRDMAWPIQRTVFQGMLVFSRLVFAGILARFWTAHWRFAVFIIYPHFLLLVEALWSLGIALALAAALSALGTPSALTVAAAALVFLAVLRMTLAYTEKWTYLLYLLSGVIFTSEFAHGQRPESNARIDRLAQYLVEVARSSQAEEIVIVGHSTGSFLSTELLARALLLDPNLGRHGPRIVLLTVGGNSPTVGFYKVSQEFRDHLRLLAVEPSIDWIDGQSRKDVMNFFRFDPIAGHGIDAGQARRNPTVVPVRFREIIRPENYTTFRWKFFRIHFQFVMANEVPHAYDFFMIVCGPISLRERVAHPEAALSAVIGTSTVRDLAWKKLEAEPDEGSAALDCGQIQPPQRSLG